jgi:hypothetical protein
MRFCRWVREVMIARARIGGCLLVVLALRPDVCYGTGRSLLGAKRK